MIQTHWNEKKSYFGPNLGPLLNPNSGHHFFFNLTLSVSRYHGQASLCTISQKTNDSILRNLRDGWMNAQTHGQMDAGCCPTNVDRSKDNNSNNNNKHVLFERWHFFWKSNTFFHSAKIILS